jgi:hypothetical protein
VISAGRYRHFDPIRTDSLDQGVEVAFFDAAGKRVSLLRCRVGVVTQRDRNTLALGSVVVTATDSTILETEALRWENESERIYGDGPVTIRRPDGLETGIGFESSPDLKRWSMRDVITRKRR